MVTVYGYYKINSYYRLDIKNLIYLYLMIFIRPFLSKKYQSTSNLLLLLILNGDSFSLSVLGSSSASKVKKLFSLSSSICLVLKLSITLISSILRVVRWCLDRCRCWFNLLSLLILLLLVLNSSIDRIFWLSIFFKMAFRFFFLNPKFKFWFWKSSFSLSSSRLRNMILLGSNQHDIFTVWPTSAFITMLLRCCGFFRGVDSFIRIEI